MNRVLESVLKLWPVDRWGSTTIVLAISGGPDSVALLRAIDSVNRQMPPDTRARLVVAHLNHRLRGVQSDQDEKFVRDLASQLRLDAVIESLTHPDTSAGEAHWRKERLAFLRGVAQQVNARWVATGATSDDSVETMLHHLLRGTGPAGMSGIRLQRPLGPGCMLIHPLIELWKSELLHYLESIQQPYRIDSTNLENGYTRNRIRNECLPYLERFSGQEGLKRRLRIASDLIRQEHEIIEGLASKWLDSSAVVFEDRGVRADFQEIAQLPWPVLQCGLVGIWHRMQWPLQRLGHEHWQRVRDWIDSARVCNHPKRMQLPGPIEMRIARRVLYLRKPD